MHLPVQLYDELTIAYPTADGPHPGAWRLGDTGPISLTDAEGRILADAIQAARCTRGIEIGTGFGMSSFWAGLAFQATGGDLDSLDAYSETTSHTAPADAAPLLWEPPGLVFAMRWRDRLRIPVRYAIGRSPAAIPAILDGRVIDYALIDGYHYGDQPLADVRAILPYLAPRRPVVLAFHDGSLPEVQRAIDAAAAHLGGEVRACATRHDLVLVTR